MTTNFTEINSLDGYIRIAQLIPNLLPFSKTTLWRKVKDGSFPAPIKLSTRITAWRVSDIDRWISNPS